MKWASVLGRRRHARVPFCPMPCFTTNTPPRANGSYSTTPRLSAPFLSKLPTAAPTSVKGQRSTASPDAAAQSDSGRFMRSHVHFGVSLRRSGDLGRTAALGAFAESCGNTTPKEWQRRGRDDSTRQRRVLQKPARGRDAELSPHRGREHRRQVVRRRPREVSSRLASGAGRFRFKETANASKEPTR